MRSKSCPLELMDIKTREILFFKSIIDSSKFLKVNYICVRKHLQKCKLNLPYRGYLIKRKSDEIDWPEPNDIIRIATYSRTPIKLRCIETGVITECATLKAAGNVLGISKVAIHNRLKNNSMGPVRGHYLIRCE